MSALLATFTLIVSSQFLSASKMDPSASSGDEGIFHIRNQSDFDAHANSTFSAGSKILFARGEIFNGQFAPTGRGSADQPILVTAYDPADGSILIDPIDDRPILNGHGDVNSTFFLRNSDHWEINNLEITNTDGTTRDQGNLRGIYILADDFPPGFGGVATVAGIVIRNCFVHSVNGNVEGKGRGGIHVHAGGPTPTRFQGLLIENNIVKDVGGVGIGNQQLTSKFGGITSPDYLPWQDMVIRNNRVERSGRNAIIFRVSENAIAEYNTLAHSSRFSHGHSIFNFNTVGAVMQFNEAYGNTGGLNDSDRGGFDADYNSRGTIIQYNYSHDNHWFAGIMRRGVNEDITIRYNISQNERIGAYFYGFVGDHALRDVRIYNNTHYFRAGLNASIFASPSRTRTPIHTSFWNNIFYFEDSGSIGSMPDPSTTEFSHNVFYNVTPLGSDYVTANPRWVDPGTGGIDIDMRDPERLAGYRLRADSPAIGRGRIVPDNGGRDFWGAPTYHGAPDIGAHENQEVDPDAPSPPLNGVIHMPVRFHLGSTPGRDDGERLNPKGMNWSLEEHALRLTRDSGSWSNAVAAGSIANFEVGTDFVAQTRVTLTALDYPDGGSFQRFGIVILGQPDQEDLFDPADDSFYSLVWMPHATTDGGELRLREGFNGTTLAGTRIADAENPPARPSASLPENGLGETYTFQVRGTYTQTGALEIAFTLMDEAEGIATLSTSIKEPAFTGNIFGFGGRLHGNENPVLDFRSFELTTAEDFDQPRVQLPFSFHFGSDPGRANDWFFTQNRPEDWSLVSTALRVSQPAGNFVSTAAVSTVANLLPRADFKVEAEITPVQLEAAALNRIGLILLGQKPENSPALFDPNDDASFYHVGFYPRQSGSIATIRIRQGLNGPTLEQKEWEGLHPTAANPDQGIGSRYRFQVQGRFGSDGTLGLSFTLTDAHDFSQTISAEIATPLSGNTFGMGARLAGGANPVFDHHRFSMAFLQDESTLTYNDWRSLHFNDGELLQHSISGPLATPAGDKVPNLLKYAFDIEPWTATTTSDLISADRNNNRLQLTYTEMTGVTDIEYIVEFSEDLSQWWQGAGFTEEVARIEAEGKYHVTVQATQADGERSAFLRLRVRQK